MPRFPIVTVIMVFLCLVFLTIAAVAVVEAVTR